MDCDVLVAGGGIAGTVVAQAVLRAHPSASVLVVDRSPESEAGSKSASGWVCGDAVSREAVDYMSARTGVRWGAPEIEHSVRGVVALSPDRQTRVPFEGEGYMLNRRLLPQRQNERAAAMGAEFAHGVNLTGLLHEGGRVCGAAGRGPGGAAWRRTARVVVDAAGMTSTLRGSLACTDKVERRIDRADVESTGRRIVRFEPGEEDPSEFDPDYCLIHLDQDAAPGGYGWVFPKGAAKANVGLGVEKGLLARRNARLGRRDSLDSLIAAYLGRNRAVRSPRDSDDPSDAGNAAGNFQVSVRRQNDCLVAPGYVMVGDSAWMPKPLDAGGIGPALIAGAIAGRRVAEALQAGDVSEAGLWAYNKEYVDEYGYKTAGLELFRRLIQSLSNEQIDYGMRHFLGGMDVESISRGEHPDFGALGRIGMAIRGAVNRRLAGGLRFTTEQNRWLVAHYRAFPESPAGFAEWAARLRARLAEANARLAAFQG